MTEYAAPSALGTWLECLFYFVALIAAVAFLIRTLFPRTGKDLPQPLQVQYAQRLATHDELQQLRREFETSQSSMTKQIERIGIENEQRSRRLHERIEELPQKIINLLRDTKGLIQ